jgi:hypothetical protein
MLNKSKADYANAMFQISTKCFDDVADNLDKSGISEEMDLQRWCYSLFHIASFIELTMVSQAGDKGADIKSFVEIGEIAFEKYLEYITENRARFRVNTVAPDEIRHFGKIIFGQMFDSNQPITNELFFEDMQYGQKLLLAGIAAVYIPERDMHEEEELTGLLLNAYVSGVNEVLVFCEK